MMRKIVMMIAAAMLSVVNIAQAAESLSIADFEITAGETKSVAVALTSDMPYVAFQFDLLLPDGLSVAAVNQNKLDAKLGEDMADDHTLFAQKVSETENLYRFVCFSMTNSAFLKTSGTVMNIAIQAATDVPDGKLTGTLKKIAFTDRSAVEHSFADATFTITCKNTTAPTGDIAINETNFPDENFRNYLLAQDYGKDGVLTEEEIKGITIIDVNRKSISSLKGIEHFTALVDLDCSGNQLTALDVSNNTALTDLSCGYNPLTTLNVSNNTALTYLSCDNNRLTKLDVSNNTALTYLSCNNSGQLTAFALDISKNIALTYLSCNSSELTKLNVSNNTALTYLSCNYSFLAPELDVSKNIALTYLSCDHNSLTKLDVSNNTALTYLSCSNNRLTALDVSNNTALTTLYCSSNQLTALDVSNNTALPYFDCSSNQLTKLIVSKSTALTGIVCCDNQIKGEAMDAFISSLSQNTENKSLIIYDSSISKEGNVCTKSQVAAAKAKGWIPKCLAFNSSNGMPYFYEYEGSDDPKGTEANPFTPAEANAYGGALAANEESEEDYYIRGMVVSIKEQFGTQYGNATFYISADGTETDQFYIYRALYLGNTKYAGQDLQLRVGDDVVVCGKITNYLGRLPETVQEKAYVVSINGITSGIKDVTSDGKANAPVYTLQGQKVTTPQKGGIYIVGGKKMVVK